MTSYLTPIIYMYVTDANVHYSVMYTMCMYHTQKHDRPYTVYNTKYYWSFRTFSIDRRVTAQLVGNLPLFDKKNSAVCRVLSPSKWVLIPT